jgi:hypothetical protein
MRFPSCLCVSPPINYWMPKPIFMKVSMYIMAPESITTAYFMNSSHQSVCLYMYPLFVARQRLGKNATAATNTHVTIEELLDVSFYMRFMSHQRKVGDLFFPETVAFLKKNSVFWDAMPCSPLKDNRCFERTCRLHIQGRRSLHSTCFTLVSCFAFSSNLMIEAKFSSEASVDFQRTIRRYMPEDRTLRNNRCENLKCYIFFILCREKWGD